MDARSISVGLVAIGQGEQQPWETVLSRADTALYEAKAQGRNRVALGTVDSPGLTRDRDILLELVRAAEPEDEAG